MDDPKGEDYWRERAEQLQHALDSRIVVEQAKGILSERVGLEMDGAFSLLRYAARGAQMKIHALAQLVVDSDDTPEPVVRALARHASVLTRGARAERIVQTEIFFRAINEEIALLDGTADHALSLRMRQPGVRRGNLAAAGRAREAPLVAAALRRSQRSRDSRRRDGGRSCDGYLIVRKNK